MDKKLKAKWVKALRSGKYKQQREGALKVVNLKGKASYCCLGVLCEVGGIKSKSDTYIKGHKSGIPHFRILERAVQTHLAEMNDYGKTFKTIADYIEDTL